LAETGQLGCADGTVDIPTTAVAAAGSGVDTGSGDGVGGSGAAVGGSGEGDWGGVAVMAASAEGVTAGWDSPSVGGFDMLGLLSAHYARG